MHLHSQGLRHLRKSSLEETEKSRPYFEAAIEADQASAFGYLGMGFYYRYRALFGKDPTSKEEALNNANTMADKATELDPDNCLSHYLRGRLRVLAGQTALATARFNKAAALNPSASYVLVGGSSAKLYLGETEGAIEDIRLAMEIDPLHPEKYHWQLGWALWENEDCDTALESF